MIGPEPANPSIRLRGVRVHNLKGVDLDLPRNTLVAVTGVSGAGKSSLVFDVLYAEGRRRYVETFSAYSRQFLERLERPDADAVENIPPALAVGRQSSQRSGRGTVATSTEIHDALALLFGRVGRVFCMNCGRPITPARAETIARAIDVLPDRTRYQIAYPFDLNADSDVDALLAGLRTGGFGRLRVGNQTTSTEEAGAILRTGTFRSFDVIVDRLMRGGDPSARRGDSIEVALAKGLGRCRVIYDGGTLDFIAGVRCGHCGTDHLAPEPRLFAFNHASGACPACSGLGWIRVDDVAVSERVKEVGEGGRGGRVCPSCGGARLRREGLAVRVDGRNIVEVERLTAAESRAFLSALPLEGEERTVARAALAQALRRLECLDRIGLGYLALDRSTRTLSGGESQRVALAKALGSGLVNTLYVLDEPASGLHPSEVNRLVEVLRDLVAEGNTVVAVEHHAALIRAADLVVDLGPGAGENGGRVVYFGPPAGIAECGESRTGAAIFGTRKRAAAARRRPAEHGSVLLTNARQNNLKSVNIAIPLGVLCVVSGVSGAGKSTLIERTLYPMVRAAIDGGTTPDEPETRLEFVDGGRLDDVALVDDAPIGRTARSNPVTYLKAFDEIRRTFASTHEARLRNFGAGRFSFNVAGGRCEACEGNGTLTIDMQFLADVTTRCPECRGRRYRAETLAVTYRGKSIADVLDLTAREALGFFKNRPKIQARLRPLLDVGLDYLRLGQPASTLSGGEAQRLKLASRLAESTTALRTGVRGPRALYLLDEPTRGLHPDDVDVVLEALATLISVGHSVVAVEHHDAFLAAADWIVDLGPGAGDDGGRLIGAGTPEDVARLETPTGRVLRELLEARPQG